MKIIKKLIKKIVFVGGGTLGHIFPMVPVVKMLKEENPGIDINFIGTKNGLEKDFIESTHLFNKTYYLDAQGFRRSFSLYNLKTILKYFINRYQSKKILKELKPEIVVGMGGYVTGSVLKSAYRMRIKTVIHEQNSVFGFTNRLLKKDVDLVLLSYDIEKNEKTYLVGNPRISEIYHKYKHRLFDVMERNVLIVGGSRGATKINDLVIGLKERFEKEKIKVMLITGNKYYKDNVTKINNLKSDLFIVKSFVKDLATFLLNARVVVTRCGATTISEVMALRKVCLFIPSPNVTNNHQEKNALEIVEREGALMIRESELTKDTLFENIVNLLDNEPLRKKIITNINLLSDVNACRKFVDRLYELMNR